jgi:DNA-binding MarR family transcriptional regulator
MSSIARRRAPAPSPAPALRLDAFLPYRLAVLADRVSRAIAARYEAEFDLTIPEWRVMALVGAEPGLTAAEVAEATPMDKVAVSRAVRSLADAGRLRAETDAQDGRRQRLRLTPAGLAVYRRVAPRALELEARLLGALTGAERGELARLMAKLEAAAGRL